MFCIKCGTKNNDDSAFCKECGVPINTTRTSSLSNTHQSKNNPSLTYKIRMLLNKAKKLTKRQKIVGIVILVALVGGGVSYFIYRETISNPSYTTTYVDPGSGETVITTPNKTPEKAAGSNNIIMLGSDSLINDYGMTLNQVNKLKAEFKDFSSSQKTPIKEVSITLASGEITSNPDTYGTTLKFTITIDRSTTLTAVIDYWGIGDPNLSLYNPSNNTPIFSSK